jgi:O-Antigen ligase
MATRPIAVLLFTRESIHSFLSRSKLLFDPALAINHLPIQARDKTRAREKRHRQQANIIALLVAVCLAAGFLVFFKWHSETGEELCFLALTAPVIVQIASGMASPAVAGRTFAAALPYIIPLGASFVFNIADANTDPLHDSVILLNTMYALALVSVLASSGTNELWSHIMRWTAITAFPLFVYVAIDQRNALVWGRWSPYGEQPNWWGMMALSLAWSSLAWRSTVIRVPALTVAMYYLFRTQARGSIVALVPAVLLCGGYFIPLTRKKLLWLFATILMCVLGVLSWSTLTSHDIAGQIAHYFAYEVMKINDPMRGVQSGLTGRTEAYQGAWDAFLQSPFIGNGYSEFEFVHNGFLITAAESGIFALVGLLYLFASGLRAYVKVSHWPGVGYVLSYILTIMTFPRSININMTSLLFLMVLMRGVALKYMQQKNGPARHSLIRTQ